MRANCWHGKNDVRVETVPDPKILTETDAIIRITWLSVGGFFGRAFLQST